MDYNFGPQRLTDEGACIALWLVTIKGLTPNKAATLLDVHPRQVSRVIRGESHQDAVPIEPGPEWTQIWEYLAEHRPFARRAATYGGARPGGSATGSGIIAPPPA